MFPNDTEKLCDLSEAFYGEDIVSLITRMVQYEDCMETLCRVIHFMEILWKNLSGDYM